MADRLCLVFAPAPPPHSLGGGFVTERARGPSQARPPRWRHFPFVSASPGIRPTSIVAAVGRDTRAAAACARGRPAAHSDPSECRQGVPARRGKQRASGAGQRVTGSADTPLAFHWRQRQRSLNARSCLYSD